MYCLNLLMLQVAQDSHIKSKQFKEKQFHVNYKDVTQWFALNEIPIKQYVLWFAT